MDEQTPKDIVPHRGGAAGRVRNPRTSDLSNLVFGKVQPQAVPLEEAVLGALMLDRDAMAIVIDILKSSSFYTDAHQLIYKAMLKLFERSAPIDLLTVTEELRKAGDLEKIGGAYYLVELSNRVASAANTEYHARIVSQKFIQREMIKVATKIIGDAYEDTTDVFELMDAAERDLFAITQQNLSRSVENIGSITGKLLKQIEELAKKKDGLTGVPTGYADLDRITSGWQPSDLIIIAARPAMGKCLGRGTGVMLADGRIRKVEDVRLGDLLMGDDSAPRQVQSITRGREKMYRIEQLFGQAYRANEPHILSLCHYQDPTAVVNLAIPKYLAASAAFRATYWGYKVAVEFDEQPTPMPPYLAGLYYSARHKVASEQEAEADLPYEQRLAQPKFSRVSRSGEATNEALSWQSLGVPTDSIHDAYLRNSTAQRQLFLAGLVDGLGAYDEATNSFEIWVFSDEFRAQLRYLCDTLGLRVAETADNSLVIAGNIDELPTQIIERAAPWQHTEHWKTTQIEVVEEQEDDYFGFEIDGNRLFLLADATVTHNTALTLALARNAAMDFGKGVAIFSLEMASIQLVQRIVSMESEVASESLRSGRLEDYQWHQLQQAIDRMSNAPIFIDDTPGINIFELRAKCRRLKMQHDISMVIIDYLQLMSGGNDSGKNSGNREQEISAISRALKGMAKELNVPVIALSQLSRAVETRGGTKRPQLSDLRESGAIEQDADIVTFIYRPEYYGITEDEENNSTKGLTEVIVAKHRNGSLGTARLRFVGEFSKFTDFDDPNFAELPLDGGNSFSADQTASTAQIITRSSRMNDDSVPF